MNDDLEISKFQIYCRLCDGAAHFLPIDSNADSGQRDIVICRSCGVRDNIDAIRDDALATLKKKIADDWETIFTDSVFKFERGEPIPESTTNFYIKVEI